MAKKRKKTRINGRMGAFGSIGDGMPGLDIAAPERREALHLAQALRMALP